MPRAGDPQHWSTVPNILCKCPLLPHPQKQKLEEDQTSGETARWKPEYIQIREDAKSVLKMWNSIKLTKDTQKWYKHNWKCQRKTPTPMNHFPSFPECNLVKGNIGHENIITLWAYKILDFLSFKWQKGAIFTKILKQNKSRSDPVK